MKTAILVFLAGILLNLALAQERPSFPRWGCNHNSLIMDDRRAMDVD